MKLSAWYGTGQNLNAVAGEGNLRDTVFQLVEHTEAHGSTRKLVEAAYEENPGNAKVAEIARRMGIA
ncbi:MAG TPA: effector-associated domain EAD1-containing protein [Polyangium sp.]|nr:effector-associated domain EAD1-containing protein [Polyangium sp.]